MVNFIHMNMPVLLTKEYCEREDNQFLFYNLIVHN